MIRRCVWYFIGLAILTLGQRMFVEAGMGAGSLDALCVGLSEKTACTAGSWIWITGIIMMLISAILYRRKVIMTALLTSFIFGVFFDLWGVFFGRVVPDMGIEIRILLYVTGIILAPLGTAIYFNSNFSKSTFDGFLVAVKDITNISIGKARMLIEVGFCLMAYLAGGPVGITTVVTALLFGPILQKMLELINRLFIHRL